MIAGLYDCFKSWHRQGTVFIYSDTHFNDAELEIGHPRPYTTEEHIKRINSKVGKNDTLILLGDVGDIACVPRLRAKKKILIMGNHDAGRTNYERRKTHQYYPVRTWQKDEALLNFKTRHPNLYNITIEVEVDNLCGDDQWYVTGDNRLFDEVYEGPLMIGEKFILSHEPLEVPWAFNFHGHDHAGAPRRDHLNCCADVVGYEPINLNQFMRTGPAAKIPSIHRITIDKANLQKQRKRKKINGI